MSRPVTVGDDSTSYNARITFIKENNAFALLYYHDIRVLEGRILTLIDASTPDRQQREALKSVIRQTIWWNWANGLEKDQHEPPTGIPDLDKD